LNVGPPEFKSMTSDCPAKSKQLNALNHKNVLMSGNKDETAFHGCHSAVNLAVHMRAGSVQSKRCVFKVTCIKLLVFTQLFV